MKQKIFIAVTIAVFIVLFTVDHILLTKDIQEMEARMYLTQEYTVENREAINGIIDYIENE